MGWTSFVADGTSKRVVLRPSRTLVVRPDPNGRILENVSLQLASIPADEAKALLTALNLAGGERLSRHRYQHSAEDLPTDEPIVVRVKSWDGKTLFSQELKLSDRVAGEYTMVVSLDGQ